MSRTLIEITNTFSKILNEIPELTYVGNPVLRKETTTVIVKEGVKIGKELECVLLRLRAIAGYGRGLAAPQIGVSKKVFVTYVDDEIEVFINPEIVSRSSSTNKYRELCISCGTMSADVKRPETITMRWTDINGGMHEEEFSKFKARLYQHEEAHLRGVVNVDEAENMGLQFATFDPLKETLR